MKSMITGLMTVLCLASAAQASQLPFPNHSLTYSAEIETFDIDSSLPTLHNVTGGQIARDVSKHQLRLTLFRKDNCPKGAMCIAVMPAPLFVTLPIIKIFSDTCGSVTYLARRDARPVDGNLETIVVRDNTNSVCHDTRATTEISWNIVTSGMGGSVERYNSRFTAGRLELQKLTQEIDDIDLVH